MLQFLLVPLLITGERGDRRRISYRHFPINEVGAHGRGCLPVDRRLLIDHHQARVVWFVIRVGLD